MIPLRSEDFFTGIFAVFAIKRIPKLRIDAPFYQAMQAAFDLLRANAEGLDIRFCLRLHPIYGDLELVRYGIADCVTGGLLSYNNAQGNEVGITMKKDFAETLLASLPGGRRLYERLAETFFDPRVSV